MGETLLFHTGFEVIRDPDVHYGKKNADFGQGFYLSPDSAFSERWARTRSGMKTWLNTYALRDEGLKVLRLERDAAWAEYIYRNRAGYPDGHPDADVIVGPIANDTIYDVWGITTSGLLTREQSLALLRIGPDYRQVVVKTERAAARLTWQSARALDRASVEAWRAVVRREEEAYQGQFLAALNDMLEKR